MKTIMRHQCGLLKNAWYAASQSQHLKSNTPKACVILEEMLVLWRTESGKAIALADRCPHRNALLSEGRIHQGQITCPYHGWTFNAQGHCTLIPSESKDGTVTKQRSTEVFPTREQDGIVWVWMGGEESPPDKDPFPMPYYNTPGWETYYMETRFANNVTNLVENFMDVAHTVFVHGGWFRDRKAMPVPTRVERRNEEVLATYDQSHDEIGWSYLILNPKKLPLTHTDHFFMPNNTRVDYLYGQGERGFVIASTCTPISEYDTMVYTLISFRLGWFTTIAKLFLPWYTRQVIEQDVEIMEIQQRALRHYGGRKFQSTQADLLHVYIESLRNWAAAGGTSPRPRPVTKEITFWI